MKFRLALPAFTAAALLIATPGLADNADNRSCPNETDWIFVASAFDPKKDKNGDFVICQKLGEEQADKDNNNPPEFTDNAFPAPE